MVLAAWFKSAELDIIGSRRLLESAFSLGAAFTRLRRGGFDSLAGFPPLYLS
jgi:hypothetical protein